MNDKRYDDANLKAVYIDFIPESNIGVRKKVSYQIEALENLGVNVIHAQYNGGFNFGSKKITTFSFQNKILRKLNEVKVVYKLIKCDFSNIDFIYLRYVRITPWFYLLLYSLSKKVDKLFVEIATYPYDGEVHKYSILSLSDNFLRTKLEKFVNKFFYFGLSDGKIWGVPAIKMFNAIAPEKIKPIDNKNELKKGLVNFISVSKLAKWHGYDRFIDSLSKSPKSIQDKVLFHIVGDGPERRMLEQLVKDYRLEPNVIFYGSKQDKELDEVYNKADIGVASLGLYRIGLDNLTPIKMSEYAAKGLPFILANTDPRFEDVRFTFKVANDASLFDLNDIVEWYETLDVTNQDIRKYAEDNLTWKRQMQKVIDAYYTP